MQCQVSSPIYLLYVLSCPDMLWLTGDFLYWCPVVCSSFVCTTVVSTTCVCTVQSLLMCTKLHCTTELVIFSAAVVCGGWWAAESVAMALQCIVPDQMSDDSQWFKCWCTSLRPSLWCFEQEWHLDSILDTWLSWTENQILHHVIEVINNSGWLLKCSSMQHPRCLIISDIRF